MTLDSRPMIHCTGCGFYAEREDVVEWPDTLEARPRTCLTCLRCRANPEMKESYRRGFNAGLDALKEIIVNAVGNANVRKPARSGGGGYCREHGGYGFTGDCIECKLRAKV
jgi:hypothetical protein